MGISDGMQGSGGEVDCSVGTIVWVRRRNGSWWPGRILGPNELSSSHLMSPRSGTPVKLLGREDASVDWYNLEKSKRVKAFRCGEFDDCIERAESSQGIPIKKREKYARREDAILHALELERELLEKKQLKLGGANCVSSKLPLKKEAGVTGSLGNDPSKLSNLKTQTRSEGLDSSEEESKDHLLDSQRNENGKKKFLDNDKCESIPRMRGLQDLGRRTTSKRKHPASVDSDAHQKSFSVGNHVRVFPHGSRSGGGEDRVGNSKNLLSLKRKKTQGGLVEESLVKRRDRRRPLVQVLQSSAKLPVSNSLQFDGNAVSISVDGEKDQRELLCRAKRSQCVYLPGEPKDCSNRTEIPSDQMQILQQSQRETDDCPLQTGSLIGDSTFSGSMDLAESDSSERDYLNPDMDDVAALSGEEPSNSRRFLSSDVDQGHLGSMDSGELDESAITGPPYLRHHDQSAVASDVGVSKWQLKGKRNTRNLMKRPMEMDGNTSNGFIKGARLGGKGNTLNQRALGGFYHASEELACDYDDDHEDGHNLMDKTSMENQMLGYGSRRYRSILKTTFRDRGTSSNEIMDSEGLVWDANGSSQAALKGYWDESGECFNTIYAGHRPARRKGSTLVDVDLKVQTSYQGEHVPLVSLMSRLNGKAIIGHPIQIETLDDGSSDHLLSTSHDYGEEPTDMDGSTALTPVWRTARRTAMHRVPRPHPSKALDGGDEVAGPSHSDIECKPMYKKMYTKQTKRPPTDKKYSKKSQKKVNLSNQKTRTLSSIAIEQKFNGGKLKAAQKDLDGLIKPEETRATTITCIPVKLAFSRLLEAVGRPPRTANHSVSANGNTEKRPS